jgi:hypothetical protein
MSSKGAPAITMYDAIIFFEFHVPYCFLSSRLIMVISLSAIQS